MSAEDGWARCSQRLEVLQQGPLLGGRQGRAVDVSRVAVARRGRVISGADTFGFGPGRHEADAFGIHHVVAAPETCWPFRRWRQQVREGRYGAVVQVWAAEPQAIVQR